MAQILNKKICLLGEYGVGKTSLIRRFVYDLFSDDYITTIGVKVTEKLLPPVEKEKRMQQFRFMIWDIAGSEEGAIKHENYWVGASGALIVTDLCRPDTFSYTSSIIEKLMTIVNDPSIVIVGNKADLIPANELKPLETTLKEIAQTYRCPVLLTSAKTGKRVEASFNRLAQCMME